MQKKVRNINKKLADIDNLEGKADLKPEQEDKVNRKPEVLEEKRKYLEFIEIYQNVVQENEKSVRKFQLSELEDLATLLAAREYGA